MIAILDVDGTLLQWREAFEVWALQNELISPTSLTETEFKPGKYNFPVKKAIEIFNESHFVENLPPVKDAIKGIKQLHKAGFQLKVNSSFSTNYAAHKMRESNLINVFGNIFTEMNFVGFKGFDYIDEKVDFIAKNCKCQQNILVFEDNFYVLDQIIRMDLTFPGNLFFIKQPYNVKYTDRLDRFGVRIGGWKDFLSDVHY